MAQSTKLNSLRLNSTRQAFAKPCSLAYEASALSSLRSAGRSSAAYQARLTCSFKLPPPCSIFAAKCFDIDSMSALLSSASACRGEALSVRRATCIEGSAQSSAAINGSGCERKIGRASCRERVWDEGG